jgi:hypothetical protein
MADVQFLGFGDPRGYKVPTVTFQAIPVDSSDAARLLGAGQSVAPGAPFPPIPLTAGNVAGLAQPPVPQSLSPSSGITQPLTGLLNPAAAPPPTNIAFNLVTAPGASVPSLFQVNLAGQRVRFTMDTPTAALRGVARDIASNTATGVVLGVNLPAVPVALPGPGADVCFIEENPATIVRSSPILDIVLS